jgi:hypothetical protein
MLVLVFFVYSLKISTVKAGSPIVVGAGYQCSEWSNIPSRHCHKKRAVSTKWSRLFSKRDISFRCEFLKIQ